jgi:peptide subunit release factor 1 (eRF1)
MVLATVIAILLTAGCTQSKPTVLSVEEFLKQLDLTEEDAVIKRQQVRVQGTIEQVYGDVVVVRANAQQHVRVFILKEDVDGQIGDTVDKVLDIRMTSLDILRDGQQIYIMYAYFP